MGVRGADLLPGSVPGTNFNGTHEVGEQT
jgi:hypothetical protein